METNSELDKIFEQTKEETEKELKLKIEKGELPKTVYKFRLWDDYPNDNIIKKRTIKLSSPFELMADYSETMLPLNESIIDENYMMKVAKAEALKTNPLLVAEVLRKKILEIRSKMTLDDKEERDLAYKQGRERNNETLGVFCASYTYEHIDQWVYLADDAKGFVVGLDFEKIYMKKEIFGTASFVTYYPENNIPTVNPYSFTEEERIEKSFKEIFHVPDSYNYEREFRIVRTNHRYGSFGKVAPYIESERIINLEIDDYTEILIGFAMSEIDKDKVIKTCEEQLPGVPLFETKKIDGKVIKGNSVH